LGSLAALSSRGVAFSVYGRAGGGDVDLLLIHGLERPAFFRLNLYFLFAQSRDAGSGHVIVKIALADGDLPANSIIGDSLTVDLIVNKPAVPVKLFWRLRQPRAFGSGTSMDLQKDLLGLSRS